MIYLSTESTLFQFNVFNLIKDQNYSVKQINLRNIQDILYYRGVNRLYVLNQESKIYPNQYKLI